jgi:hypothetical protein
MKVYRDIHVAVEDKQLFACVLHCILTEVVDQVSDRGRLVILAHGGHAERVAALVREEHFEATSFESD